MSRKKKEDKPVDEEHRAERKPHIVWYDADGVEIGDDGYPMTPIRRRMHKLFNLMFIWGVIAFVLAVFCTAFAYAQNQNYTMQDFELIVYGGTQINGFEFATLLRIEGLFCLLTALVNIASNFIGFHWMYDKRSPRPIVIALGIIGIGSFIYEVVALWVAHLFDPVSAINIVLVLFILNSMSAVKKERPTLKKAKRVTKVVKK
ncbi:isocitrate lyase [Eggerthella sp. YY7918]|uniref:isocitrate lyase n=1 Tax=Eggerthella sp. (strain YY7918) TaxID=502558 RepID=UPI0002171678|nr:isocitrate lyase [Eggerthella sp. YY7918]BAK44438.1 isocitrate lyase [Eggerthella sp. YY7918]